MNMLLASIVLSTTITLVVCFRNVDTECMKKMNDLNAMDDRELCISIDENVKRGQQMALNRAAIANSDGLFCYKQFYDKYYKKLEKLLMEEEGTNCPELLAKTTVHSVRKDATKAIAEITQAMVCNEQWKTDHFKETINAAKCSANIGVLDMIKFKTKLIYLKSRLGMKEYWFSFKNTLMSGMIEKIATLYKELYTDAEECSLKVPKPSDKCHNLKMFIKEIDSPIWLDSKV